MAPKSFMRSARKQLRPLRRFAETVHTRIREIPYRFGKPVLGTTEWLIQREIRYGGLVGNVTRRRVSPLDGRTREQLAFGGMTGGDRMLHHGYGATYARYLQPFLNARDLTVAEFGILNGTGLAIWCDLFPDSRVLGFDIDLSHFMDSSVALRGRGAFKRNSPELFEYDQLVNGRGIVSRAVGDRTLDIVIDDGLHSIEAILNTWRAVEPRLSLRFAYFIEDCGGLLDVCGNEFTNYTCRSFDMMTVVSRGLPEASPA